MRIDADTSDILFRGMFCSIFVGLGGEHLFADDLIQHLMPEWMPFKRLISLGCGVWLVGWGGLLLVGWKLRWSAVALGSFVIVVTAVVHVPGVLEVPAAIESRYNWMWDILQRSNLAKNLCLLGVCFHLLHHKVGKYSLEAHMRRKKTLRAA